MIEELKKNIEESFNDLRPLTLEAVHQLIKELLLTFTYLGNLSRSSDPKERSQAFQIASEIREFIDTYAQLLANQAGLDLPSFLALAENEALFQQEAWAELGEAKREIEALKRHFGFFSKPSHPPIKKNKSHLIPA